jgi:uncharacterized RDD family membrane protein YckC
MKTPSLQLKTPEGIVFSQQLAGPLARFFAWAIDVFCILALLIAFNQVIIIFAILGMGVAMALNTLGYFIISIGYGILFEWLWRGQTLGKKLLSLRVVDAEGMRLQFDQIVMRNLLRFIDSLPLLYVVGGVACWLSRCCQRLGDLAANTIVIRIPRVTEPQLEELTAGKFNSLRQHPHLAVRLRQGVSPSEASLAAAALLRRDELESAARLELFGEIAAGFRAKVKFPQEATDGLSDEQYVRNVLDIVYSRFFDSR